ncbi:MAG: MBL fold metallo-hydrolase [Candidatus Hadarchaeales archaeon]
MTSITFYGGVNEIGGNKILLEDRDTRVWFDFGASFNLDQDYFAGWLQPRSSAGLKDYFEFDLVPKIPGLYSEKMLKFTDLKYRKPEFDAVFISHPHFDHMQHIEFIDGSIPVYISRIGKAVVEAWQESSSGRVNFGDHDYRPFEPGNKIRVGSLEVLPMAVDHSVPGACGFIAYTSEGPVVYTGDFRKHGPRAEQTLRFLEKVAEEKPAAMICEGTRVAPREERRYVGSEKEVASESERILKDARGPVVVTFYGRDVDRMKTFAEVARRCGREFVVSTRVARLLTELSKEGLEVPRRNRDFTVYIRRLRSGEFSEKDYYCWERDFLDDAVNFDYVHKHQNEILLNLDFTHFAELIDIQPDKGGNFIHSMSEPLSDEDMEADVMQNWLEHFGLNFHQVHSSGHCTGKEIDQVLKKIEPALLFPVHTEHPEMFRRMSGKVCWRIRMGRRYEL